MGLEGAGLFQDGEICAHGEGRPMAWVGQWVVVGRRGAATSSREGLNSVCVLGAWRRRGGQVSAEAEEEKSRTGTRGSWKEEMR